MYIKLGWLQWGCDLQQCTLKSPSILVSSDLNMLLKSPSDANTTKSPRSTLREEHTAAEGLQEMEQDSTGGGGDTARQHVMADTLDNKLWLRFAPSLLGKFLN